MSRFGCADHSAVVTPDKREQAEGERERERRF